MDFFLSDKNLMFSSKTAITLIAGAGLLGLYGTWLKIKECTDCSMHLKKNKMKDNNHSQ